MHTHTHTRPVHTEDMAISKTCILLFKKANQAKKEHFKGLI